MSELIKKPRGTKDIYGNDEKIYRHIFNEFELLAKSYNLRKIITPMFESYDLFKKSNGESSDIVVKEIYRFEDFGKRILALRPEGTAPVGRAIAENNLHQDKQYNKLYYIGSMFRYEKPQKGRLRQFYQIGIELTNELSNNSILDSIVLASTFLNRLQIKDFTLLINNLGTHLERENYIKSLKQYFKKHKNELSEMSIDRIELNPLRILDDKIDSKLDVVINAPKINEFLSEDTKNEFNKLLEMLDKLNIKYEIDYSLVRGLDYYSNTVFEFVSNSHHLGSKSTLIGGGCYLNLMRTNTNQINGVGFGCGVERLFEIIKGENILNLNSSIDAYFIFENENDYQELLPIVYKLRSDLVSIEYNYKLKNYKKCFNDAKKINASLIIFKELNQINTDQWTIKSIYKNNISIAKNEIYSKIKEILNLKEK